MYFRFWSSYNIDSDSSQVLSI